MVAAILKTHCQNTRCKILGLRGADTQSYYSPKVYLESFSARTTHPRGPLSVPSTSHKLKIQFKTQLLPPNTPISHSKPLPPAARPHSLLRMKKPATKTKVRPRTSAVKRPVVVPMTSPAKRPVVVPNPSPVKRPVLVPNPSPVKRPILVPNPSPVKRPVLVPNPSPVKRPVLVPNHHQSSDRFSYPIHHQ